MTKKKVLILSASIGTGHTQAARAVEEYIRTLPEECEVEQLDFLSNDSLSIDNLVKETYIKILDVFPMLYDLMYYSSQGQKKGSAVKTLLAWGLKRRMQHILDAKKPDVLICTHPFPAGAAALLKRQHRMTIPVVGIITDFAIHQLWVYPQIDVYCVAASQIKDELAGYGVPQDKILVSGIPVRQAFQQYHWAWDTTRRQDKNILIMGGGLGMGSMKEVVRQLDAVSGFDSFTVVTGYNADLYDELSTLKGKTRHHLTVLGYTNQIPELMEKASLLITKPGALTCTEAATVQVPILLYNAIPGQEEENAVYLQNKGCAVWVQEESKLSATVADVFAHPEKLEAMSQASLTCHRNGARIIGMKVLQYLYPREPELTPVQPSVYAHDTV